MEGNVGDRLYTLEEYVELLGSEVQAFLYACRRTASQSQAGGQARTLDEWDQMFDDFAAEKRLESDIG